MGTAYRSCKLSNFGSPLRTHPKSRTHRGTRTWSLGAGAAMMGTGLTLVTNQHSAPMANVARPKMLLILTPLPFPYWHSRGLTIQPPTVRRRRTYGPFLAPQLPSPRGRSRVISCTDLAPISVMVTRMSPAKSSNRCETPRCPAAVIANFSDLCFSIGRGSDHAPSAECAGLALRDLASK
jgi:hypothetical protein